MIDYPTMRASRRCRWQKCHTDAVVAMAVAGQVDWFCEEHAACHEAAGSGIRA